MFFEETRVAFFVLLGQPVAVASVVVLAGLNAAIWLLVFQRTGFPTALASLLLVPPLNFVLPLYFAFARWPGRPVLLRKTTTRSPSRPVRRRPQPRMVKEPLYEALDHRWPMRLAADGLPRFRIPMEPSASPLERDYRSHSGI